MGSPEPTPEKTLTRGARYRAQLDAAEKELAEVDEGLELIEEERAQQLKLRERLKAVIEVLGPICEEQEKEEEKARESLWADVTTLGIQEYCYRALLESEDPLDAQRIEIALEEHGVNIRRYKNPHAVIHTSLKRIPEKVRSFRKKERVGPDGTRMAWVRYYEAIRPGGDEPPKQ